MRILLSLDDRLTEICQAADVGPQDVIDAAVAYWMLEHGWLESDEVPAAAAAAMKELEPHHPDQPTT